MHTEKSKEWQVNEEFSKIKSGGYKYFMLHEVHLLHQTSFDERIDKGCDRFRQDKGALYFLKGPRTAQTDTRLQLIPITLNDTAHTWVNTRL